MKRLVIALGFAIALLIGSASPVRAGDGYWSPSPCRADVEWYATSYGVFYWLYGYSETHGAKLVRAGYYLDTYRNQGYECGTLGAPLTDKRCPTRYYCFQDFQGGRISSNF